MSKGKKIVLASVLGGAAIFVGVLFGTTFIRYKIINDQAMANINVEQGITTIYSSNSDIKLFSKTYDVIKQQNLRLVIANDSFIVEVANENIQKDMDIDIKIIKDKDIEDCYSVNVYGTKVDSLNINMSEIFKEKEYVSLYQVSEDNKNLINNSIKVENGYSNILLQENINNYVLAYIVPNEINLSDMTIDRGIPVKLDMGSEYTNGTVNIECNDKEAIQIDEKLNLTGLKVGEYTLNITTSNANKSINVVIRPTVERIELDKTTLSLIRDASAILNAKIVPEDAINKEITWTTSDENIVSVTEGGKIVAKAVGNCEITVKTISEPIIEAKVIIEVKEKPKVTDIPQIATNIPGATYVNGILLVNKNNPIPSSYAPGLNKTVWQAFLKLKEDAAVLGHDIQLLSGYRSYATQQNLYSNYVATYGQAEADTFSARPGTSEHQTGLAMDVGWIDDAYGDTASGKWLAANCHKYGFIIRYPKGKEHITGYKYEPWHIRYLGVNIATDVYQSGLCLEEYLGVQ